MSAVRLGPVTRVMSVGEAPETSAKRSSSVPKIRSSARLGEEGVDEARAEEKISHGGGHSFPRRWRKAPPSSGKRKG